MNRVLFAAFLFLAALAGALWFLGVFDRSDSGGGAPAPGETPSPAAKPPDATLDVQEPLVAPPAEVPDIVSPVRVLVLADSPRSFLMWLLVAWEVSPRVEWQAWFAHPPEGVITHSKTLPPLEGVPTAADLDGFHVLVVSALDPARFDPEFWRRVAERVKDGRLGLLAIPEFSSASAMAGEESLHSVLPVESVLPPKAVAPTDSKTPALIPGVLDSKRPFVVTPEGTRHPASRLVSFPGWSEKLWARYTRGGNAWTTPFVAPATGVARGASVLLRVESGDAKWPALVASGGESGRALWAGGLLDLNWDAYRTDDGYEYLRAMVVSWIAWLAPPR